VAVDKRGFGRVLRFPGTGSADSDHAGYFAVDDPLAAEAAEAGEPVDMAQVRADDAFIETLTNAANTANANRAADPLDERMASLLLSWRDEVGSKPAGPVIDLETAMAAIRNAPRPQAGRQLFGPLAAAAAVLVIAFTGIGLAARDAVPGTPLFGVTKILYSDKAKSVEAAVAVRSKLDAASQALSSGRVDEAQAAMIQVQKELPGVAPEDGKGDLVAKYDQLNAQIEQQRTPDTTPPPASTSPMPSETTPAPTSQRTVTTTQAPLPTTTNPQPPPPLPTSEPPPVTTSSATAEGTSSVQSPGGKSGESVSNEPLNGTSSPGSGSSGSG
jgi:hypothetical protein